MTIKHCTDPNKYNSFTEWFPKSGFMACGAMKGTVLAGRVESKDRQYWYDQLLLTKLILITIQVH